MLRAGRRAHPRLVLASCSTGSTCSPTRRPRGLPRLPPLGVRVGRARPRAAPGAARPSATCSAASRGRSPTSSRCASARWAPTSRRTPSRLLKVLERYPGTRFKLDPTNTWTPELIAELADTGAVDSLDLKGKYKGTPVDVDTDPELYRTLAESFPDAWLEDPDLDDPEADAGARAAQRPDHLGRADPLDRRHRGAALPAEDGEHQAVALRAAERALRRLRLLRGAGHRRLRRRAVRARRRPRPHPVPGGADAPRTRRTTRRRRSSTSRGAPDGLPASPIDLPIASTGFRFER